MDTVELVCNSSRLDRLDTGWTLKNSLQITTIMKRTPNHVQPSNVSNLFSIKAKFCIFNMLKNNKPINLIEKGWTVGQGWTGRTL